MVFWFMILRSIALSLSLSLHLSPFGRGGGEGGGKKEEELTLFFHPPEHHGIAQHIYIQQHRL